MIYFVLYKMNVIDYSKLTSEEINNRLRRNVKQIQPVQNVEHIQPEQVYYLPPQVRFVESPVQQIVETQVQPPVQQVTPETQQAEETKPFDIESMYNNVKLIY